MCKSPAQDAPWRYFCRYAFCITGQATGSSGPSFLLVASCLILGTFNISLSSSQATWLCRHLGRTLLENSSTRTPSTCIVTSSNSHSVDSDQAYSCLNTCCLYWSRYQQKVAGFVGGADEDMIRGITTAIEQAVQTVVHQRGGVALSDCVEAALQVRTFQHGSQCGCTLVQSYWPCGRRQTGAL